jgi:LmbE family N-acetylglucosaminyl deacetylase
LPIRLMCLTAHPDDEAGAFGGALLMAAERGFETAVLCLTEGSAGSYRTPGQTNEQLAALRREEFASACTALQVSEATLLQYPDGELWQQPFLLLVGVLVEAIRRFRPHIVLTFGGEGGVNQHRDHTMVSLAATAAFHWAGRSAEALLRRHPVSLERRRRGTARRYANALVACVYAGSAQGEKAGRLPPAHLATRSDGSRGVAIQRFA